MEHSETSLYGLPVFNDKVGWKILFTAVAVDDDIGADAGAIGDECALADDGMACVQFVGKEGIGRGAADKAPPTWAPKATMTCLSMMTRSTCAPGPIHESFMMMLSCTTAPGLT